MCSVINEMPSRINYVVKGILCSVISELPYPIQLR